MGNAWSEKARKDFDERKEYREKRGEKDRYEKAGDGKVTKNADAERDAKEARIDERGFDWMKKDEYDGLLMQLRNSLPEDNLDNEIDRLRNERDYYESERTRMNDDYDYLAAELERVKKDNRRYMMRDSVRGEKVIEKQQMDDIKEDGDVKTFEDLWDTREG